ncbi:MAG: PadR family transcriptional regulator [Candidatus Hermodarchaeota archaeon]|nr:PadR family transcriptional regulator [Candidatus Hermodarchaeota archaeon]
MSFPPFFQRPKGVLLRITILRLLREGAMHGYELMKQIEQTTDGRWVPSHSLLYTTLSRLKEQGLISDQPDHKGKVERTVYTLTEKGSAQLDEMLTQMAQMLSRMMTTVHERPIPRLPRLLLDQLPPEEARNLLLKMRISFEEIIKDIDEELQSLQRRQKP